MFAPFRSKPAFWAAFFAVLTGLSHTDTIIGLFEGTSGSARLVKAFLMEIPHIPSWAVWICGLYSISFLGFDLIERRRRPIATKVQELPQVAVVGEKVSPRLIRPHGPPTPDIEDRVKRKILSQYQHGQITPSHWQSMAHYFKVFKGEINASYKLYRGLPWKNVWSFEADNPGREKPVDIKDFIAIAIRAGKQLQDAVGFPLMPKMGNSLDQVWLNTLCDFFELMETHTEDGIKVSMGMFPDLAGHSILLCVQLQEDPTQLEDLRWRVNNLVIGPPRLTK